MSIPATNAPVQYVRISGDRDVPPASDRIIDVALMDMNHRWPNMGHEGLVAAIREAAAPVADPLTGNDLSIRILSYDVRAALAVPEPAGDRFLLYVGTGGPGHIDPAENDGSNEWSQGIAEDPSWEPKVFALFESIRANEDSALIAVCHTFGIMCRWSGVAAPVLRSAHKGGKSSGLVQNVLSGSAVRHPWFSRFAAELPEGVRFTVIDNRFFDLVPVDGHGAEIIAYEAMNGHGAPGEAVTMIELARDRGGVMPRMFGVNHHPEVIDRAHALSVLRKMMQRGEVTREWYEERATTLTQQIAGLDVEALLRLTSQFTLLFPLQFHLTRLLRLRLERLGIAHEVDEHAFIHQLMQHARSEVRL